MYKTCPTPQCIDGVLTEWNTWPSFKVSQVSCPTCQGTGQVDEREADLQLAGIVLHNTSEEDFRSSPTLIYR